MWSRTGTRTIGAWTTIVFSAIRITARWIGTNVARIELNDHFAVEVAAEEYKKIKVNNLL